MFEYSEKKLVRDIARFCGEYSLRCEHIPDEHTLVISQQTGAEPIRLQLTNLLNKIAELPRADRKSALHRSLTEMFLTTDEPFALADLASLRLRTRTRTQVALRNEFMRAVYEDSAPVPVIFDGFDAVQLELVHDRTETVSVVHADTLEKAGVSVDDALRNALAGMARITSNAQWEQIDDGV